VRKNHTLLLIQPIFEGSLLQKYKHHLLILATSHYGEFSQNIATVYVSCN